MPCPARGQHAGGKAEQQRGRAAEADASPCARGQKVIAQYGGSRDQAGIRRGEHGAEQSQQQNKRGPGGHAFQGGSQHGIRRAVRRHKSPAGKADCRDEHGAEQQSGHADAAAVTALRVSLALRIRPKSMGQTT